MTRLLNSPEDFADELVEGLLAANQSRLRAAPGGVVRRDHVRDGRPALVIGGGSGHYPAFGGLVGPGLADGAVLGNVFASPSAQQIYDVARSADRGGGLLLSYGNYAGDVLNFDRAQERLRAEGYEVETVVVTDDISSAPAADHRLRRGVAGDLVVFKIAGAAIELGASLAELASVARRANDRTRTLGVAFTGCTLPGASAPLFTVPEGRMAVGLGIHGEPGIGEVPLPTADELAELFVESLLAEVPEGSGWQRTAVVLNGLGSVKYEELFVVYRRVHTLLTDRGVSIVDPEVGEFCTSFDMAGASLTMCWLDDELESLWSAPADSPAYRRAPRLIAPRTPAPDVVPSLLEDRPASIAVGAPESRAAARRGLAVFDAIAGIIREHAEELGRIDAVAGDGDHGIGMLRGADAARDAYRAAVEHHAGLGTAIRHAGQAWADRSGGTSGALWGVLLEAAGTVLGDEHAPDTAAIADAVIAGVESVRAVGKAAPGDKTMVDALVPFADELDEGRDNALSLAWSGAARRASEAATATAELLPRLGRARPHAERSLGTPDAGAVSFALIATAVGEVLSSEGEPA